MEEYEKRLQTPISCGMYVPEHTRPGIINYIKHHRTPGSFLLAVFENKLKETIERADIENIQNIPAIVNFLYNYAPSNCWGSPEKVKKWLDKKE